MAKDQTMCKELKTPEQMPNYFDVAGQGHVDLDEEFFFKIE